METYHKINAPFKRDMDGSITGQKGKLIVGDWALPEFAYLANNLWEFTEKVDGTNIRILLKRIGDDFTCAIGGRTNNAVIPTPLIQHLESMFRPSAGGMKRYNVIMHWMVEHGLTEVYLFGEGYGPKIQGGGKYRDDHSFVLFDVKIGDFWLDRENVNDVADKLGIESVPVLGAGTLTDAIKMVSGKYPDGSAYGPGLTSQWGDFEAEGIVARPVVPLFDRHGNRIITKIKAKDFR